MQKPYSKKIKALIAHAKRVIRVEVKKLHAAGLIYTQIETELHQRPNNGMTSWRAAGNRHKPAKKVTKAKLRRTGAHAVRALRGTLKRVSRSSS